MNEQAGSHDLRAIAHNAMIDRGLEPDFPSAALGQLNEILGPARDAEPAIRDLRKLLWCSIDNDTSRDLLGIAPRSRWLSTECKRGAHPDRRGENDRDRWAFHRNERVNRWLGNLASAFQSGGHRDCRALPSGDGRGGMRTASAVRARRFCAVNFPTEFDSEPILMQPRMELELNSNMNLR